MNEHRSLTVRPLSSSEEGGSSASAESGQVKDEAIKESTGIHGKEDDETARRPRIARRPQTHTQAEVDAHMTLHAEYRDWCPHYVSGRGSVIGTRVQMARSWGDNSAWITRS